MRAINHALTGAAIGLVVGEPLIAVPAALASHFVCDIIPHYSESVTTEASKQRYHRSRLFRFQLIMDALLCLALVSVLFIVSPGHWLLASICAFAAASPDFLWVRSYVATIRNRKWHPSKFDVFAGRIQWFQRPIGAVVEIAWFIGLTFLLWPFLH